MVRVIEVKLYTSFRDDLRGNKNYFELAGGWSYLGLELPGVKFTVNV